MTIAVYLIAAAVLAVIFVASVSRATPMVAAQLVPTFDLPLDDENYLGESSREASELVGYR